MGDFYFVYYDEKKNTALRLYRYLDSEFERFDKDKLVWIPAPEQACILVGEDWDYDEINEKEAMEIIDKWK